ncbi:MAG: MFS transporter [Candidatus Aquirickettsiella sp.]
MPKFTDLSLLTFSTLLGFINRFSTDIYAMLLPFLLTYVGLTASLLNYSVQVFYVGALFAVLFFPYILYRVSYKFFLNILLTLTLAGGICFLLYPSSIYFIILARFLQGLGLGLLPIFVKLIVIQTTQKKYQYKTLKISNTLAKTNIFYPLFPVIVFFVGSLVMNAISFDMVAILIILLSSIAILSLLPSKDIKLAQEAKEHNFEYHIRNNFNLLKHNAIRNYAICFGLIASLIPAYYYTLNQHWFLTSIASPIERYTLMLVPAIGLAMGRPLNILATKYLQINKIIIISITSILFFSCLSFILLSFGHLNRALEFLSIIPVFIAVSLISTNLTAKISNIFRKYSLELLQILSYSLYIFSGASIQLSLLFVHKNIATLLLIFISITIIAFMVFIHTFFSKEPGIKTRRGEWRTGLFSTSTLDFLRNLKLKKLNFDKQYTSTVYFQNQQGELLTLPSIRLRSYVSLAKLDKDELQRFIESGSLFGILEIKKPDGTKYELCDVSVIKAHAGPTPWQIFYEDKSYYFHSIKIAEREHFTLTDLEQDQNEVTKQILPRVTIDKNKLYFIMGKDGSLSFVGNLGRRIEFKYKTNLQLKEFKSHLDSSHVLKSLKYRSFEFLFQDILRAHLIYKSSLGIPEIEKKFSLKNIDINEVADRIVEFIKNKNYLKPFFPHPYLFSRIRKYHLCCDPNSNSDTQYTIVETLSGKYSIKIKDNSRLLDGSLIRDTQASYTTDLDGKNALQHFLCKGNLKILNSFVKYQYKISFVYHETMIFTFSIDECVDKKNTLRQLELEYSGTLDTHVYHSIGEIMLAMNQLNDELLMSNLGSFLEHTEVSKFIYFTKKNFIKQKESV